jgi:integrase/recombinase XerD
MRRYEYGRAAARVSGPIAPFAAGFAEALMGQGYDPSSVWDHLGLLAQFSAWLGARGRELRQLQPRDVEEFGEVMRRTRRCRVTVRSLGPLLGYLRAQGVLEPLPERPPAAEGSGLLQEYREYLRAERSLSETTIRKYSYFAADFLGRVGEPALARLAALTGAQVMDTVSGQVQRYRSPSMAEAVVADRALLRFCHRTGRIGAPLDQVVPPAARRPPRLPARLDETAVSALLGSCDRCTERGSRDYAVLVLLRRYGLRGIEVSRLQLEDLRWRAGEIVLHGKAGRVGVLPLTRDAGQAVAEYLQRRRPAPAGVNAVFLTVQAPRRQLTLPAVQGIVRQACVRAGIGPFGTRPFRHGLGCDLLAAGASLLEIAEVLRHSDVAVTAGYARVDAAALAVLVRPWPGSGQLEGGPA